MSRLVHETCLLLVVAHGCKALPDNGLADQLLLEWSVLLFVEIVESLFKQRSR